MSSLQKTTTIPVESEDDNSAAGDASHQINMNQLHIDDFIYQLNNGTTTIDQTSPGLPSRRTIISRNNHFFREPMKLRKRVLFVLALIVLFREGKLLLQQCKEFTETTTPIYSVKNSLPISGTYYNGILNYVNRFMLVAYTIWMYNFILLSLHGLEILACTWRKLRMSYLTPNWCSLSRQGSYLILVGIILTGKGSNLWKLSCEALQDYDYKFLSDYYVFVEEHICSLYTFDADLNELLKTMLKQLPLIGLTLVTIKCRRILYNILAGESGKRNSVIIPYTEDEVSLSVVQETTMITQQEQCKETAIGATTGKKVINEQYFVNSDLPQQQAQEKIQKPLQIVNDNMLD